MKEGQILREKLTYSEVKVLPAGSGTTGDNIQIFRSAIDDLDTLHEAAQVSDRLSIYAE